MISIDDIVKKEFSRSFLGYDMREVDLFLDAIIEQLEADERERQEMLTAMEYLLRELEQFDDIAGDADRQLRESVEAVRRAADGEGVRAIIFRSPCIALFRPKKRCKVNTEKCTGCRRCIRELGCPALVRDGERVKIDASLCYGCTVCETVCPFGAISH